MHVKRYMGAMEGGFGNGAAPGGAAGHGRGWAPVFGYSHFYLCSGAWTEVKTTRGHKYLHVNGPFDVSTGYVHAPWTQSYYAADVRFYQLDFAISYWCFRIGF